MEKAFKLLILLGAISGSSEGAGVLPDGPLNATIGETVIFITKLIPTEEPFLSVVWDLNDVPIITSEPTTNITNPDYEGRITLFTSTGSLEVQNLNLNDSGLFSVDILPVGEPKKIGSTRLNIYVLVSSVTVVSSNTDLIEFGSSVSLFCSSSGSSLSFIWMNGSSEVTASDRVQITNGGSNLTFVNISRYDHGTYWCVVSNPVSSGISDPVSIVVSYGPENLLLNVSPEKHHYEEGSNIQLTCSAESRPPAEMLWFLNGVLLSHTRPNFRLMNIQMNQTGNYSCQAFNNKTLRNQISEPSVVSVLARVSNILVSSNAIDLVELSSSVTLSCSASGFSPNFFWMNSTSEVTPSDRVQITDEGSTLTIVNVTRADLGLLRCHAFNYFSEGFSNLVNLPINYGPENLSLMISPSEKYFKEGSDISLFCTADSRPAANFNWFLNGDLLTDSGSELRLINVKLNHSGNYSCQAFNNKTLRYQTSQPAFINVEEKEGGLSAGAIAGIVIGCLIVLIAGPAGGYFVFKKLKNKAEPKQENVYESVIYNRRTQNKHS